MKSINFFNNKFSKAKVDNLVFSHRYRGKNANEDFQVSLHAVEQIIELMKNKMSKKASIVIINSIAIKTIVDDQPQKDIMLYVEDLNNLRNILQLSWAERV